MSSFTIIPDIHADIARLERSLAAVKGRPAFLGDFIDAGGDRAGSDRAVLERVRKLVDGGRAVAVMGNHELNAVLYHTIVDSRPLRTHSKKNRNQHRSFLNAFGPDPGKARYWVDWLLEALPLWHEADGFRLIHAYWSDTDINLIRERRPDGRLTKEDLPEVAAKETPFAQAVDHLLSGQEAKLPGPYSFLDSKGALRRYVRLAWWRDITTWQDAALSVPDPSSLPKEQIPPELDLVRYPDDAPPVFVGHYKMTGIPQIEQTNAVCLDYPEAACVYHWQGESGLQAENLEGIL